MIIQAPVTRIGMALYAVAQWYWFQLDLSTHNTCLAINNDQWMGQSTTKSDYCLDNQLRGSIRYIIKRSESNRIFNQTRAIHGSAANQLIHESQASHWRRIVCRLIISILGSLSAPIATSTSIWTYYTEQFKDVFFLLLPLVSGNLCMVC